MKKFFFLLGLTTCLSSTVLAGLQEGVLAYQYKQYPTALAEFTYLSDEGDPAASYYLGKMYLEGLDVPQNSNKAKSLFHAASSAYYFPATAELGKMLLLGAPQMPAEPDLGIPLLKKAALAGESEAAYMLGVASANGTGVEQNLINAVSYYQMAAWKGHVKAQYALAKLYFEGKGVPQNYVMALKWLSRSANQGYVLAQVELADIRMTNNRLKNAADAYGWYSIIAAHNSDEIGQKAAEKRDVLESELDNKVLISRQEKADAWKPVPPEKSVPKEELENVKLPTIAGFNDPKALQDMIANEGYLPRDGRQFGITVQMVDNAIVKQDAEELTLAIDNAARDGKKTAYAYYGDLYKTRLNNPENALLWYKKGAEAGDVYGAYQLAKMYCEGRGVKQPDAVSCYAWLKIAQEEQNPVLNGLIQNALNILRTMATPEELAAGEELLTSMKKTPEEKEEEKTSFLNFF